MNIFSSYHPAVLMMYFISVLLVAMFTQNPVMIGAALAGGICFCALLENSKTFWHNLAFYIPMFILIALTNPLFSHNGMTPLFFLNGNPITLEAVLYGLDISAMLVAVIYWFKCYNRIMTSEKILFLFGKAIPKLSLLLSTALRFVPLFKAQIKKIHQAQKAMGLYTGDSYIDKLRSAMRVFSAMLTWSLENAIDTGDSMKARGYGLKGRSHFALFRFTMRDGLLLTASIILLLFVLLGLSLQEVAYTFYPRISELSSSPIAVLAYIAFGFLTFLPFILELIENLRWKALLSTVPQETLPITGSASGKDDKK